MSFCFHVDCQYDLQNETRRPVKKGTFTRRNRSFPQVYCWTVGTITINAFASTTKGQFKLDKNSWTDCSKWNLRSGVFFTATKFTAFCSYNKKFPTRQNWPWRHFAWIFAEKTVAFSPTSDTPFGVTRFNQREKETNQATCSFIMAKKANKTFDYLRNVSSSPI